MHPELERYLAVLASRRAPRTVEAYRRDLLDIEHRLKKPIGDAGTDELQTYPAELRAEGLAPTTIARRLSAARSYFAHEVLLGNRTDTPAAEIEPPRRRRTLPRTLSPREAERLIEAAAGTTPRSLRDAALVELLYGAGLRVSEAVGLERAGVDLEKRLVRTIGKGSEERVVPIRRGAADPLRRYLAPGPPYLGKR